MLLLYFTYVRDRRGTFRPDRVKAIADRFGVDSAMALDNNVLYARAWTSEQQCEMLIDLAIRWVSNVMHISHSF